MFKEKVPISPQPEEAREEKGREAEESVEVRKEGQGGVYEKMRNMPT